MMSTSSRTCTCTCAIVFAILACGAVVQGQVIQLTGNGATGGTAFTDNAASPLVPSNYIITKITGSVAFSMQSGNTKTCIARLQFTYGAPGTGSPTVVGNILGSETATSGNGGTYTWNFDPAGSGERITRMQRTYTTSGSPQCLSGIVLYTNLGKNYMMGLGYVGPAVAGYTTYDEDFGANGYLYRSAGRSGTIIDEWTPYANDDGTNTPSTIYKLAGDGLHYGGTVTDDNTQASPAIPSSHVVSAFRAYQHTTSICLVGMRFTYAAAADHSNPVDGASVGTNPQGTLYSFSLVPGENINYIAQTYGMGVSPPCLFGLTFKTSLNNVYKIGNQVTGQASGTLPGPNNIIEIIDLGSGGALLRSAAATGTIIDSWTPRVLYSAPAAVNGDPQLTGLQGQSFQVHGIPEEYFSLVSFPGFALNSKFVYLAMGDCTYNHTVCWQHPGTYLGSLGLVLGTHHIEFTSGSVSQGMTIQVNGHLIHHPFEKSEIHNHTHTEPVVSVITLTSSTHNQPTWHEKCTIRIESILSTSISCDSIYVRIINADMFFNIELSYNNREMMEIGARKMYVDEAGKPLNKGDIPYPHLHIHGLLGQTWKNAVYPGGKLYKGSVSDYIVSSLFSTQFLYQEYKTLTKAHYLD